MSGYRKSDSLWFEDGNIVLEAEGTVFRIYRGTLARHSPVFEAMLSFPQPGSAVEPESMDGLPVVHMADRAVHLAFFLKALHDFRQVV